MRRILSMSQVGFHQQILSAGCNARMPLVASIMQFACRTATAPSCSRYGQWEPLLQKPSVTPSALADPRRSQQTEPTVTESDTPQQAARCVDLGTSRTRC